MTWGTISKNVDIEKAADPEVTFKGLPEGTIYFDPFGMRAPNPVNLKQDMFKQAKPMLEKFDKLFNEENVPLKKSIGQALETDTYSLPVYFVPEVQVVNPQLTPAADLLARETVNGKDIKVTARDSVPEGEFGIETDGYAEASGNWDEEGYLSEYTYTIKDWGVKTQVSDFMRLASAGLRSAESVAQSALIDSQRFDEERQIHFGTDENTDGYDGFKDLGTNYSPSATAYKELVRELIDEVVEQGADPGNIGVFTDFDSFRTLRNELDDYVRYEIEANDLGFGYSTLEFDGCPVMRSHGLNEGSDGTVDTDDPQIVAIDMETNYLGVLQDTTVKPLAKVEPTEQMAVDCYSTFVSEAPSHIQYVSDENLP